MKSRLIFSFLFLGSVSFLGANTMSPAIPAMNHDNSEIVVTSFLNEDDEVCYSATVSVEVGPVSTEVEVSACAETAEAAWDEFKDAVTEPFQ